MLTKKLYEATWEGLHPVWDDGSVKFGHVEVKINPLSRLVPYQVWNGAWVVGMFRDAWDAVEFAYGKYHRTKGD